MDDVEEADAGRSDLVTLQEVYFHSVLVAPQSVSQFSFYDDKPGTSGTDRYVLLTKSQEPAIFHAFGILTHVSITAAGAVQNRQHNSKIDEYTARLRIEDQKALKKIDAGFRALLKILKETEKAFENIAVSGGLVESILAFHLEDTIVKVSNYSNDVIYFNRKVARKGKVSTDDGKTPDFMLKFPPQGVDFPSLKYPPGFDLNPLIPVTDREALSLNPESIELPRRATVYFEMKQGCYNFVGNDGPVKQIVLIPSVIAIKAHPAVPEEMSIAQQAKRRRVSCWNAI